MKIVGILQYLSQNTSKEIYQKDIEELFSIKRSTANQMLRTLENRGYIKREVSAQDLRKNIITPTKEGIAASEHLTEHMYQFMKNKSNGKGSKLFKINRFD